MSHDNIPGYTCYLNCKFCKGHYNARLKAIPDLCLGIGYGALLVRSWMLMGSKVFYVKHRRALYL